MLSIDQVVQARARIADRIHRTPTLSATRLGRESGVRLSLKCENLQRTGSFKVRGALNRVAHLTPAERGRGVIAVSAGNHAQALAYAAAAAGVPCTVVMPAGASRVKVEASRGYGAEVVLEGASTIEAFARAHALADERGLTFVHPFEDAQVVAGAGTVGLELMEDAPELDAVVVPIGGGGLASGIAVAVKALNPRVRVFGVEPAGAAAMRQSLDAGRAMRLDRVDPGLADGLAAPMAGELTYDIIRRHVDDVVLVDDAAVARAMRELLASAKLLAEGAGAAGVAAVISGALRLPEGSRVACIVSGGNVDLSAVKGIL